MERFPVGRATAPPKAASPPAGRRELLDPFRHPRVAWQLWSHMVLRWTVPFFLVGLFIVFTIVSRWAGKRNVAVESAAPVDVELKQRIEKELKSE